MIEFKDKHYENIDYDLLSKECEALGEFEERFSMTVFYSNLIHAHMVGQNKDLLKKRLLETRSCLAKWIAPYFKTYTIDYENKRMIAGIQFLTSVNKVTVGSYVIQWRVRKYPFQKKGYYNQQTSVGTTYIHRIEK